MRPAFNQDQAEARVGAERCLSELAGAATDRKDRGPPAQGARAMAVREGPDTSEGPGKMLTTTVLFG